MDQNLLKVAHELALRGKPFAIATVVRVEGSSSAPCGSSAIIDAGGKLLGGWVGGGCAESAVRRAAIDAIGQGQPHTITLDLTSEVLGVGMPCGGLVDVFLEPVLPQPELVILGHGRIAEVLAKLGSLMNYRVTVADPAANRSSFPDAERLFTDDYDLSKANIGSGCYVVIATQHRGDHQILRRVLNTLAPYVALIASLHRAQLVLEDLQASGIPRKQLDRVWTPAGIDISAATPEEIALSVMGQVVAVRRGASPGAGHKADIRVTVHECGVEV
jgi:xanthine dehydrogenase accessory factor